VSFIFILYSFLKKEYKVIFYFILFNFISTLFYFYYLNIFKFEKILDPYIFALSLVNKDVSGINNGLFSIQNLLIILGIKKYYIFIFLILILLISYLFKNKKIDKLQQLNFLFIFSTLLVYHGMYEFVILLPFVAYLIKEQKNISFFYFHAFTIIFIYYLYRINQLILKNFFLDKTMSIIGCLLLTTSSLILSYVFGASLLMYGMMVYFFSAFPVYAPLYILLFDTFLIVISLCTLFANPWQLQARLHGASGLDPLQPSFLALASSVVAIPLIMFALLYIFRSPDRRLSLLLFVNLLLIPFFFLTSGTINSFVLNDFTNNF
jgi:hypothetical protein